MTKFVEKFKTHIFVLSICFFSQNPAVYEIIWKTYLGLDRPHDSKAHTHMVPDN